MAQHCCIIPLDGHFSWLVPYFTRISQLRCEAPCMLRIINFGSALLLLRNNSIVALKIPTKIPAGNRYQFHQTLTACTFSKNVKDAIMPPKRGRGRPPKVTTIYFWNFSFIPILWHGISIVQWSTKDFSSSQKTVVWNFHESYIVVEKFVIK